MATGDISALFSFESICKCLSFTQGHSTAQTQALFSRYGPGKCSSLSVWYERGTLGLAAWRYFSQLFLPCLGCCPVRTAHQAAGHSWALLFCFSRTLIYNSVKTEN